MSLLFQMPEISVGNWHILALFCSSKENKLQGKFSGNIFIFNSVTSLRL